MVTSCLPQMGEAQQLGVINGKSGAGSDRSSASLLLPMILKLAGTVASDCSNLRSGVGRATREAGGRDVAVEEWHGEAWPGRGRVPAMAWWLWGAVYLGGGSFLQTAAAHV